METALFTFLVSMGVYHYVREIASSKPSLLSSLFWGLASLTRPEGILLFTLTTVHYLLHFKKERKISVITVSKWILPFSALVVPHFIFRFLYYGSFLPNTYFAKSPPWHVAIEFGITYTSQFLVEYGLWGMGIISPIFLLFVSLDKQKGTYIATHNMGAYYAYVISVGGDVLGAHRFFFTYTSNAVFIFSRRHISSLTFTTLEEWRSKKEAGYCNKILPNTNHWHDNLRNTYPTPKIITHNARFFHSSQCETQRFSNLHKPT